MKPVSIEQGLAQRNLELMNQLTEAKEKINAMRTTNDARKIFELDKRVRLMSEVIAKNKKEHERAYKKLWNEHQKALQKIQMINQFTDGVA